ncbi:PAAR domain-containing protein [Caballeronia choica]|uniref:PAAR domain-containing protein n=1 Tax=Caballeronia choica TaxID=326476 RepID=UPI000B3E985D|nr:PAAR domain-containing protein [Caballeronia choica]
MRRAAVRHGDPTTTGGFVIACSSTIHDDGKKVALSGDEATCGNCKGAYKIFGTGQEISEKGRAVVLDSDSVLCPCGKNRVIVGSNPGILC